MDDGRFHRLMLWPLSGAKRKLMFERGGFRFCPTAAVREHSIGLPNVGGNRTPMYGLDRLDDAPSRSRQNLHPARTALGRASRWKPLRPLHDTHQRLVGDGEALPICADARVLGATLNAGETAEDRLPVASAWRGSCVSR